MCSGYSNVGEVQPETFPEEFCSSGDSLWKARRI